MSAFARSLFRSLTHPSPTEEDVIDTPPSQAQPPSYEGVLLVCLGSKTISAGFATPRCSAPRCVVPCCVGHAGGEKLFDWQLRSASGSVELRRPIANGLIVDWEALEQLLHFVLYNELRVAPEEHPLLVTVSPQLSAQDRGKLAALLFDHFEIPLLRLEDEATLSLPRSTGLLLDFGDSHTSVIPIVRGRVYAPAIVRLSLSGSDLTTKLRAALKRPLPDHEVDNVKRSVCYVSMDCQGDLAAAGSSFATLELADHSTLEVGCERFAVPELLFSQAALVANIFLAISRCPEEDRAAVAESVVIMGGAFRGLCDRLRRDCSDRTPTLSISQPYTVPYGAYFRALSVALKRDAPEHYFISRDLHQELGSDALGKQAL